MVIVTKILVLLAIPAFALGSQEYEVINNTITKLKMLYMIPWTGQFTPGKTMEPVILKALDNIKNRGLISNYDVELHWRDTQCDKSVGIIKVIDIWRNNQDLDVIIGDACSTVCYPASLLASAWNVPIISWGCTLQELSDKNTHPTFIRVIGNTLYKMKSVKELVMFFGWKRVGIISETTNVFMEQSEQLLSKLRQEQVTVFHYSFSPINDPNEAESYASRQLESVIQSIKRDVKVVIVYGYKYSLERIAVLLKVENMDKGFIFISPSDILVNSEVIHYYENWMISSVLRLKFNKELFFRGFDDPLFQGMASLSNKSTATKFSYRAGDYVFLFHKLITYNLTILVLFHFRQLTAVSLLMVENV